MRIPKGPNPRFARRRPVVHPALSPTASEMMKAARTLGFSFRRSAGGYLAVDSRTGHTVGPLELADEPMRGFVFGVISARVREQLGVDAVQRFGASLCKCVGFLQTRSEIKCLAEREIMTAQAILETGLCVSASQLDFYITDPHEPELVGIATPDLPEFLLGLIVGAQMQIARARAASGDGGRARRAHRRNEH